MGERENGGPAFPVATAKHLHNEGMSLRDWFAGQALAGWLASFAPGDIIVQSKCAELSYRLADAMLAARSAS